MDRQIPNWLAHHGVQGQKWGIKHGPPYPIGSHPRKVFVSGTSKFKGKLPKEITSKLDNYIQNNYHVLIGDAPGIDTEVQKYLARKNHRNVTIYTIEDKPRFQATNDLGWGVKKVEAPESEIVDGYNPSQVYKDKAMAKDAHVGFAVVLENGSKATRNNVDRMNKDHKDTDVITLFNNGDVIETNTNITRKTKQAINEVFDTLSVDDKRLLWPGWKSGKKMFGKDEYSRDTVAYSTVLYSNDKPVAFLMAGIQDYKGMRYGDVGLAVRSGSEYRGKGYANKMAKSVVDWYNSGNHDLDFLFWYSRTDNPGSIKAAQSNGFEVERVEENMKGDGNDWVFMRYPGKKE